MPLDTERLLEIAEEFKTSCLLPNRMEWEQSKSQPKELFKQAAKFGLLGL